MQAAVRRGGGLKPRKTTRKQIANSVEEFFQLLPTRPETERSWSVSAADLKAMTYDLKAVNPRAKNETGTCTPEELYGIIEDKQREIADALARLRGKS